eukprot:scaffold146960_cov30-Tisochrysis_lutea.AAC.1
MRSDGGSTASAARTSSTCCTCRIASDSRCGLTFAGAGASARPIALPDCLRCCGSWWVGAPAPRLARLAASPTRGAGGPTGAGALHSSHACRGGGGTERASGVVCASKSARTSRGSVCGKSTSTTRERAARSREPQELECFFMRDSSALLPLRPFLSAEASSAEERELADMVEGKGGEARSASVAG